MDIPVIIDGVVVSGCALYTNGKCREFSHLVQGEYIECNTMCDYGAYSRKEQLQQLKQENEKLKQQLKQKQYKRELNYGQGYKAYATEKGVITE